MASFQKKNENEHNTYARSYDREEHRVMYEFAEKLKEYIEKEKHYQKIKRDKQKRQTDDKTSEKENTNTQEKEDGGTHEHQDVIDRVEELEQDLDNWLETRNMALDPAEPFFKCVNQVRQFGMTVLLCKPMCTSLIEDTIQYVKEQKTEGNAADSTDNEPDSSPLETKKTIQRAKDVAEKLEQATEGLLGNDDEEVIGQYDPDLVDLLQRLQQDKDRGLGTDTKVAGNQTDSTPKEEAENNNGNQWNSRLIEIATKFLDELRSNDKIGSHWLNLANASEDVVEEQHYMSLMSLEVYTAFAMLKKGWTLSCFQSLFAILCQVYMSNNNVKWYFEEENKMVENRNVLRVKEALTDVEMELLLKHDLYEIVFPGGNYFSVL